MTDFDSVQKAKELKIDDHIVASTLLGVDLTEVYSPERVNKVAKKYGLVPGSSLDLTNGWDSTIEEHKRKALAQIREGQPYLVIGSPPCTYFGMLQES